MSIFDRLRKRAPNAAVEVAVHLRVMEPSADQVEAARQAQSDRYYNDKATIDGYVIQRFGPDPIGTLRSPGDSACPSCGATFEKPLSKSRKCPECNAKIVVRTVDGERRAYTKDQALLIHERKAILAEYRAAFRRVQNIGVGPARFLEKLDTLGRDFRPRDASWHLLNEAALDAMKSGDFHALQMAYRLQASQLKDEGRDPNDSLAHAHEASALNYKQQGLAEGLRILACGCDVCGEDNGREIRWSEFKRGQFGPVGPLPHRDCAKGFCACTYTAIISSFR